MTMASSLSALCQGMPVIMEYLDRQSVINLPLVCKEVRDAVQGRTDVFWAKNATVKYLMNGKLTPAGIPCSVQKYISNAIGVYTLTYIPVKYGTSPENLCKSYTEFFAPIKHAEICIFILVSKENFLKFSSSIHASELCIKYQCIYRSKAWHRDYVYRECVTKVVRVYGLRQLLALYSNMLIQHHDLEDAYFLYRYRMLPPMLSVRAEAELGKAYDEMDGSVETP